MTLGRLSACSLRLREMVMTDEQARPGLEDDALEARLGQLEARILASVATTQGRLLDQFKRRLDGAIVQVESLMWLESTLGLRVPPPPTRGWAASPDVLVELVRQVALGRRGTICELGSGVSTIVMAAALRRRGSGRVISFDHDPDFAALTRLHLDAEGLTEFADVIDAPLGPVELDGDIWRWYQIPASVIPETIDLLFVDGPPAATSRLARYPALPVLGPALSAGAIVVLDDTYRDDERDIVSRWLAENDALSGREIDTEKGAWILSSKAPREATKSQT